MVPNMKLEIHPTPYNTIRVWIRFEEQDFAKVLESKEYKLFDALSIWGGHDKGDTTMRSWELSLTLKEFLKEKFGHYKNCTILYF